MCRGKGRDEVCVGSKLDKNLVAKYVVLRFLIISYGAATFVQMR